MQKRLKNISKKPFEKVCLFLILSKRGFNFHKKIPQCSQLLGSFLLGPESGLHVSLYYVQLSWCDGLKGTLVFFFSTGADGERLNRWGLGSANSALITASPDHVWKLKPRDYQRITFDQNTPLRRISNAYFFKKQICSKNWTKSDRLIFSLGCDRIRFETDFFVSLSHLLILPKLLKF